MNYLHMQAMADIHGIDYNRLCAALNDMQARKWISDARVSGIDPEALYEQLAPYAVKDCRDCDGRGVFYGNVCVCGCVMAKLPRS